MYRSPTVYNGNLFFGYITQSYSSNPQITKVELTLTFNSNLKIYIENDGSNSFLDFSEPYGTSTKFYYVINVPLIDSNTDIIIQSYEDNEWKEYEYTYENLLLFFPNQYATYDFSLYIHIENSAGESGGGSSGLLFYPLDSTYMDAKIPNGFTLNNMLNFNSKIYAAYNKLIYFDPYYNNGSIETFDFNCHTTGAYIHNPVVSVTNSKTVCLFYKIISKGNKQQTLYYADGQFNVGSETDFLYACMGEALHEEEMASHTLITRYNANNNPNYNYTQQAQYESQIESASTHNFRFGFGETSAVNSDFLNNFSEPQKIIFCVRVYDGHPSEVGEKITDKDYNNLPEILEEIILPPIDIIPQKIEVQKADSIRYKVINKDGEDIDVFSSANTDKIRLDINIKNNLNEVAPADTLELYLYGGYKLTAEEYDEFWDWYQKDQPYFYNEWHIADNLISSEITSSEQETLVWQSYDGNNTTRNVNITRNSYRNVYHYRLSDTDRKRLIHFGAVNSFLGNSFNDYFNYENSEVYKELIDNGSFFRLKFSIPDFDYIQFIETYSDEEEWLPTSPYYQMKEPEQKKYECSFHNELDEDITSTIDTDIAISGYGISLLPKIGYKITKTIQNNNFNFSKIKQGYSYTPHFYPMYGVRPNNGKDWYISTGSTEVDLTNEGDAWLLAIKDMSMSDILHTINVSENTFPIVEYVYVLYNKTIDDTYFNIENNGVAVGTKVGKENVFNKTFTIDEEYTTYFNGKTNIFPVGSIYLSLSSLNPSRYFVGTWVPFGEGRTLIGVEVDGGYRSNPAWDTWSNNGGVGEEPPMIIPGPYIEAGLTGGEETHTLTVDEMPSHKHQLSYRNKVVAAGTSGNWYIDPGTAGTTTDSPSILNTGGGQPHNNLPPYITCYMWLRIN